MGILTAVVGVLLGNFLIGTLFAPALSRLRGILDKFARIELPFRDVWDPDAIGNQDLVDRRDRAASSFNLYFREYLVSFQAFKRLGNIFLALIVLLFVVVAWQLPVFWAWRVVLMVVSVGVVPSVGLYAQSVVAPTPTQLISVNHLANSFPNLHLGPLFDAGETTVDFGYPLLGRDNDMHFALLGKTLVLGYAVLCAITDAQCTTLYFVAYGPVDDRTGFRHLWNPSHPGFRVRLGDLPGAVELAASNHLYLHLWMFVPTPTGWLPNGSDHPRYLSSEVSTPISGQRLGVRRRSDLCSWERVDEAVSFEHKPAWGDIRGACPSGFPAGGG